MIEKNSRLFSLDALRGLDMLFLCVFQPLVVSVAHAGGFADADAYPIMRQFKHFWGGFTAYDLIMPLFIFMCGAAVPFALSKRLDDDGQPTSAFWKHVAGRVVLLWLLGMVSQGNLLSCDIAKFVYYSNTLQSIAVGYAIAALVMLIRSKSIRVVIPLVLAVVYGLALHLGGDYSPAGNVAMRVDQWFVRLIQPCGHDTNTYTWYLTSLMFGVMTLCGMQATEILMSNRTQWQKAGFLGLSGLSLWAGGVLLEWIGVPCIKHVFTVSFTAQAIGICVLLLDLLYIVNDIWKVRRGWGIVTLYGQTALAAYVMGEIFRSVPKAASQAVLGGLAERVGDPWRGVIIEVGVAVALTVALRIWYQSRNVFRM